VLQSVEESEYCLPSALRSAAVIRLWLLEEAISSGIRNLIDCEMSSFGTSIRRSLSCLPADPILWVVLFWQEIAQNGFKSEFLGYLRLSYRLGPNEG
jgi:hypothetical protein